MRGALIFNRPRGPSLKVVVGEALLVWRQESQFTSLQGWERGPG
jgi:hypothetical protein